MAVPLPLTANCRRGLPKGQQRRLERLAVAGMATNNNRGRTGRG
jgi:hypothetical protein